jgi:Cu2+-exporting ATPase
MTTAFADVGLFLDGLRCAGCVGRVERALREESGVAEANVSFTTHRALVRFDPERVAIEDLVARVRALGYAATPFDPEALERPAARASREALVRLLVAAFLAGNVMLLSLALYLAGPDGMEPGIRRGLRWLAVALSLPAVGWCGLPFWRGAWAGLRRREISMDLPVALGMGTAFAASVAGTALDVPHVFIDSAAMIVFLILLGRTLERGARTRASAAVERLAALAPTRAWRRGRHGLEELPARALRAGDRVVVPPGQQVPADGRIVAGRSELDESLLSGESRPVLREPGDAVAEGSRNVLAELELEVTAAAGQGALARLAALLERAQAGRPPIQRLADRVAAVFAPAVVGLAALTAAAWALAGHGALEVAGVAAAVLIVACPCALGLATPAAVTAAIGRAASLGILFKSGEALERCARVDAAVLDKTGTLSEGRLALERVLAAAGVTEEAVLLAAADAEGASTHPLAEAIRREAGARGIAAPARGQTRSALPGRGVIAGEGAAALRVGSRALLAEAGLAPDPALDEAARKLGERGRGLAFVARGEAVLGALAFLDPPRPDAARACARLRALGAPVRLVSGDHADAVRLAALAAGVEEHHAGVSPEEKVGFVTALRAQGHRVLVAGDGVNDAAALLAADVGVAMARGADVAIHAADVVVRAPRLGAVPDALELARTTLRRIRQNLGLAVLYNAVAVPLAVVGVLEPLGAAIAMSLSSLVVTGNAVRLLRWRPRP